MEDTNKSIQTGDIQSESYSENDIMPLASTAKGKSFGVNVSLNKTTALQNSKGSYPNILYFPTNEDCIIFNGREYTFKPPFIIKEIKTSSLPEDTNLANYLGGPPSAIINALNDERPIFMKSSTAMIPVTIFKAGSSAINLKWISASGSTSTLKFETVTITINSSADTYTKIMSSGTFTLNSDA